jgi:cell division transport system permease protein
MTDKKPQPGKKKVSSKVLSRQKHKRRRVLTFIRMCRYGIDNFVRNAWLTIAATGVMTITLLIIFVAASAHTVLTDTVGELRDKVDMSIYFKTDTPYEVGKNLIDQVEALASVKSATFISAEEAREDIIQQNRHDPDMLEAIKEATNRNPATLRVVVEDINNTDELRDFVETNRLVQEHIDSNRQPSFAGDRRSSIESIGKAVQFAQTAGVIASIVFVLISYLIIFNTIRMAIFNRKEEIYMMQLIGANRSFIRGPFLVEAIMYGLIAALIAVGLGTAGLYTIADTLIGYQISIQPTIDLIFTYWWVVVPSMVIIGALIGIVSSSLATRRYL